MRLPQIATLNPSNSKTTAQATTVAKNNKRAVLSGVSCDPYVIKTTPFEFDTAAGYGLAFGDQTFNFTDGIRINPLNLPSMTAVRQQIEPGSFVTPPALCTPTNFTFTEEQMKPQFVVAANETLTNYTAPADTRQGPLVWKMTPFYVETSGGGFIANGTQSVYARGSNMSLNEFPMQLALRPSIEFIPADASPNRNSASPVVTAAPSNVYTILPVQPSSDAKIMSYLSDSLPSTAVSATATAMSSLIPSLVPSATSTLAAPSATATSITPNVGGKHGHTNIGGIIVASTFGILLISYIGKGLYNKINNGGMFKSKPAPKAPVVDQAVEA